MLPSEPFIRKTLFEARFRAKLEFFDLRSKLSISFSKDLPEWQYDGLRISMFDPKDHSQLTMDSKRLVFEFDRNGRAGDAKAMILKMGKKTVETLGIDKFDRLGLRFFYAYPSPMKYPELNEVFILKTISREKAFKDLFHGEVNDSAMALVLKRDNLNFRIQTGPTLSGETIQRIPFEGRIFTRENREELGKSLADANLFIDLDCWCEDVKSSDLSSIIEKSFRNSINMIEGFSNFVAG